MCYVGKATKIFFFVIAVLAILGLVLGVALAARSWGRKAQPSCQSPNCRPPYADPIPADASTAPNPTPTATPNPIINPTPNPTTASANSAAPPPLVGFGPPSPFSIALGPVHG